MKIQVIGLGVVGSAQAFLAKRLGHNTYGYDPNVKEHEHCKICDDYAYDTDMTFICTPESVAEETIEKLVKNNYGGLIVIKSTVPLGLTAELSNRLNAHICHNPEFLRETHALDDVMHPSRVVVGECCNFHGDMLREFYSSMNVPIYTTNPRTSELIKLVSNSFRAVAITFWNEIGLLCKSKEIDVNKVSEICNPPKLIGEWEGGAWGTKYFGVPYSGKCLPKDIRHLISAFKAEGYNPKLFDATEEFNNKLLSQIEEKEIK